MKNLFYLLIAVLSFSYCSKDAGLVLEEPVIEVQQIANLSVSAVQAGTTSHSTESSCEPVGIPNTDIGIFYDKDVSASTDLSSADFRINTGTGTAFFHNIKPGKYTVVAKNSMGEAKVLEMIEIGSNDVTLEF